MEAITKKKCIGCFKEKNISEYALNGRTYRNRCKKCISEYDKERRKTFKHRYLSEIDIPQFKICCKCKKTMKSEFFSKNKGTKEGLTSTCKLCETLRREQIQNYKDDKRSKSGCVECGEMDPEMLSNDHVDPTTKSSGINSLHSIKAIDLEWVFNLSLDFYKFSKKTRILCACCHRMVSKQQQTQNKLPVEKLVDPNKRISVARSQRFVLEKKLEIGKCQYEFENCSKNKVTEDNSCIFDFDHIDPKTKLKGVSSLTTWGYPLYVIDEEIKKCRLLCANHHQKHSRSQIRKGGVIWERKRKAMELKILEEKTSKEEDWFEIVEDNDDEFLLPIVSNKSFYVTILKPD